MLWEDVEDRYGKKLADKMKKAKALMGITVRITDKGWDIPESDIERAYKEVKGIKIHPEEWD